MNLLQNIIISGILGGSLLIPMVDVITKDIKNSKLTFIIALVTSLVIGTLIAYLQGKLQLSRDPSTWFADLSIVFLSSQTIFNLYWKTSLLRSKLLDNLSN